MYRKFNNKFARFGINIIQTAMGDLTSIDLESYFDTRSFIVENPKYLLGKDIA